jgi:hypothetical protein
MKISAEGPRPACVICGDRLRVEHHHLGGRRHLAWLTAPLCDVHHRRLHRLLDTAGVDLKYTRDPAERLLRAIKAMNIFTCMIVEALHEAKSR